LIDFFFSTSTSQIVLERMNSSGNVQDLQGVQLTLLLHLLLLILWQILLCLCRSHGHGSRQRNRCSYILDHAFF
jgi:hypothetical protein